MKLEPSEDDIIINEDDVQVKIEPSNKNEADQDWTMDDEDMDEDYDPTWDKPFRDKKASRGRPAKSVSAAPKPIKLNKVKKEKLQPDKDYQCYKCGEVIFSIDNMREHQKSVHGRFILGTYGEPRDFQCSECKGMFETEEKMLWHYCKNFKATKAPGKDYYECDMCGEQFKKQQPFADHYRFHMQEKKFPCDLCDYAGKNLLLLSQHKDRVHNKNFSHVCELCGKSFMTNFEMQTHVKRVHFSDKKDYICEECGKGFAVSTLLSFHKRQEHPKFYICTFCERVFTSPREIKKHLHFEHNVVSSNKLAPICPECKEECPNLKAFDDHMVNAHKLSTVFACPKCELTMSTKLILKLHMIESHRLNPLKATPEEVQLFDIVLVDNSHRMSRSQSGIPTKPSSQFKCEECGKFFRAARILACHKRQVHETSNHMKCEKCNYTTYLPSMLKKHIRQRHDSPRAFQCDQCSHATFSQSSLNTHKRNVHEKIKPHKCTTCDKGFWTAKHVANHMLRQHGIVMMTNKTPGVLIPP